jgi:hypothetical protein
MYKDFSVSYAKCGINSDRECLSMCLLYTDALTVGLHNGGAGMLSRAGNFYGNEKWTIKSILITQQQKINCQIESEL